MTSDRSGTPLVYFHSPSAGFATSAVMAGSAKQGVSTALMLAQAKVSLKVNGRLNATDQFSVTVGNADNGTALAPVQTTGTQTTAATGWLPIATSGTATTDVQFGATVTGSAAANYKKTWRCEISEAGKVTSSYTGADPTSFAKVKELQTSVVRGYVHPGQAHPAEVGQHHLYSDPNRNAGRRHRPRS